MNSGDPIVTSYILGRLPPGAVENLPPYINYIAVVNGNAGYYDVMGEVEDPNGDLAWWELKVSHFENGKETVDEYTRTAYFSNDDPDRVVFQKAKIKLYPGKQLKGGRDYLVEVAVWDGADQCDRRVMRYRVEDTSQQPPAEAGSRNPVGDRTQYEYSSGFFSGAKTIGYLIVLGFVVFAVVIGVKRYRERRAASAELKRGKTLGVIRLGSRRDREK